MRDGTSTRAKPPWKASAGPIFSGFISLEVTQSANARKPGIRSDPPPAWERIGQKATASQTRGQSHTCRLAAPVVAQQDERRRASGSAGKPVQSAQQSWHEGEVECHITVWQVEGSTAFVHTIRAGAQWFTLPKIPEAAGLLQAIEAGKKFVAELGL